MKYRFLLIGISVIIKLCFVSTLSAQVPYFFIENKGQFEEKVKYQSRIDFGTLFLEEKGYTLSFFNNKQMAQVWSHDHKRQNEVAVDYHAIKIIFLNALTPKIEGKETYQTYYNYFLGKDESKWQGKVPLHGEVYYTNIYKNIDFRIYNERNALKSDWIVKPYAEVSDIALAYQGQTDLFIKEGKLMVKTSVNEYVESAPFAYQMLDNKMVPVSCSFQIVGDAVGFVVGNYDKGLPLIIDPLLVFSTYSGSRGDNFGFTATYDSKSNLYAGGIIDNRSGEYPVTAGAFQQIYGGGVGSSPVNLACDISISKYDSSGSNLLYATYLGGAQDEYPHSLVVDNNDNLVIFGTSNSANFPVTKTAHDTLNRGAYDIIVSKLSSDGGTLMGSTYVGGQLNDGLNSNRVLKYNYADDFRGDVIVDDANHVFIASTTFSGDFPIVKGFQTLSKGGHEGCMLELSPNLDRLIWSSFVGGVGADALYSIKLDANFIYAAGGTSSNNLDTTGNVLFKKIQGGTDGYLVKVDKATKKLERLSYWGTSAYDQVYFIQLDNRNSIYVAGQTEGSYTPTPGTYGTKNKGQFMARLTLDFDSIYWQTTFGSRDNRPDISPSAFLVDKCNHIYLSGWGSNVDPSNHPGSTSGLEVTAGALQSTTDNNDFYIIVLDQDARGLLYATYFGGYESGDHVDGGTSRFDKRGVIYQSVCSSCPEGSQPGLNDFPVTPKAAFIKNVSPRCSNASFKIDLQIKESVIAKFLADPIEGCKPLEVTFTNISSTGKRFVWDFGDGTTDSVFQPAKHSYPKPGNYLVSLTAIDSLSCNVADRYELVIIVIEKPAASFTYSFDACSDILTIKNTTKDATDYAWDFGDGSISTDEKPEHKYTQTGTFEIVLIANPFTPCPDTVKKSVQLNIDAGNEFIIPNVFTPNRDGKNDCFKVQGLNAGCDEMEWMIYNRWGECVFYSKDLNACWDGNNEKGEPYPDGVYFSIFNMSIKGKEVETISGTVTLIR